jgi:hypothetical protein
MRSFHPRLCLIVLCSLPFVSCLEDPKLVAKRKDQAVEIVQLKGKIAMLDEQLKNIPADVSAELREAKEVTAAQAAELALLETEVAALEERKRTMEGDFDRYRAKYAAK